jgi:pyridoxine 4-dehydrogenase
VSVAQLDAARLKRIATKIGATPAQVALAWWLARSPVTLPIPGTNSIEHLEENARATKVRLSAEDRAILNA